jgi:hypothetical protein
VLVRLRVSTLDTEMITGQVVLVTIEVGTMIPGITIITMVKDTLVVTTKKARALLHDP